MHRLLRYLAYATAYTAVLFMFPVLVIIFIYGGIILYDPGKVIVGFEITVVVIAIIVLTSEFIKDFRGK